MSQFSFPDTAARRDTPAPRLTGRTRRRAALRLGWYLHALLFLLVQAGLASAAWLGVAHSASLPSPGWALALAIHGLVVALVHMRAGLLERMVEHEHMLRNMG
jgi:hypothetical protein